MMSQQSRITLDPATLAGKPAIAGTWLSVEFVIGLLAEGSTQADSLDAYPGVQPGDVAACLAYARDVLASERIYPSAA